MRDETREHTGHGNGRHGPHSHHPPNHHHHSEGEHHGHREGRRAHGDGSHFGGPRGRARRGEARYVLLDALRDGARHGYEIIKALEERSGGRYAPSPGTVYPTMQYLEDQGLVRADQEAERRVYRLTEAGRAELDAHADALADFWGRFTRSDADSRPEAGFLRDALDDLGRTAWGGLKSADSPETVQQVRQAIEQCQNAVREIIASGAENAQGQSATQENQNV